LAGLVGIAFVVRATLDQAQEQVLPSVASVVVAGVLSLVAIMASARAWGVLFDESLTTHVQQLRLRGTFYLSQLTKYLPVGGVVQATSQMAMAKSFGIPLKRVAVAFAVTIVGAVTAGATLSAGLALNTELQWWLRLIALSGLLAPALLYRPLMAKVLHLAHQITDRIPDPDHLPSQRQIVAFYLWAIVTIGSLSAAYAAMMSSLNDENPFFVFCGFAFSWIVGFLVVPIPAGVGIREAVLVAVMPGVGAAQALSVSLALRLLAIAAELVALGGNKLAERIRGAPEEAAETPPDARLQPGRDVGPESRRASAGGQESNGHTLRRTD